MAENMVFMMVTAMLKNFYLYPHPSYQREGQAIEKTSRLESLSSYILSACQQMGALEGRTFWTYIQIKPTLWSLPLNKQYFLWLSYSPIGFRWDFMSMQEPRTQKIPSYQWINPKNVHLQYIKVPSRNNAAGIEGTFEINLIFMPLQTTSCKGSWASSVPSGNPLHIQDLHYHRIHHVPQNWSTNL